MTTATMSLKGKHVVITGASSGLGAALALDMAAHGARIALLARRQDRLQSVAQQVKERGGKALPLSTDVGSRDSVDASIARAEEAFGPVDVLVANAGMSRQMSARELDAAVVEEIMKVNFMGVVYAMSVVLPSMVERRSGVVLTISSLAAFRGLPIHGPYCASKAAVSAWMQSLRVELRETGVKLITAHPGYIDTEMTAPDESDMPYMLPANEAARKLVHGLLRGASEINFPWQLAVLTKVARSLPNWLYDRVMWGTSSVSWGTAARDAFFWVTAGLAVCVLAWLSVRAAPAPVSETLKAVYSLAMPALYVAALVVSRLLRGSTKVPILIVVLSLPLAAVAAIGWLVWP